MKFAKLLDWLLWAVAVALIVFASSAVFGAEPRKYSVPGDRPATFYPYSALCQVRMAGGMGQGSGTLIATRGDKGLVLTCRHVAQKVGNVLSLEWLMAGKQITRGTVVRIVQGNDFNTDLALVVCDRPVGVRPASVARFDVSQGPWVGAGYRDSYLRIAESKSAAVEDNLIVIPTAFIGGQSGGALFNNRGHIVAVIVATSKVYDLGVSVDGDAMHNMIDEFRGVRKPRF